MRGMIIASLLLIAGQASAERLPYGVSVFHDAKRGATCWIYSSINLGGISCLPDSSLPQNGTAEREASRASQASSVTEKGISVATPLPQEERFNL